MLTYYEKSNFLETPKYDETIEYCKKLSLESNLIKYTTYGKSPQGRDLPLLIVCKDGDFDLKSIRKKGKVVLLIQACIHAGEPDGKDAGLMLIRDIVITKTQSALLDNVCILFIPIVNVDGHERYGKYTRINQNGPVECGWRTTAQNYNMNRDFMKADAPETQAWLQLYNEWLPDFFVDCHVTDGADYQYAITYAMEVYGNMAPEITKWTNENYINKVEKLMKSGNFPITPYVQFRNWHDPRSGLISWVAPPMLSQGYAAIQNRPGLLIESHMLKDYKTRVTATYEMLKNTLIILNSESKNLLGIIKNADDYTASSAFRKTKYPIQFEPTSDSTIIDFLGFEYEGIKSDLTGGTWFKYSHKPINYKIPFFNKQKILSTVDIPEAYIIPPEWIEVISKLKIHGIDYTVLETGDSIFINSKKFRNAKFRDKPYEGRQIISTESNDIFEKRYFPAGSVLIKTNQRNAGLIAHLFESTGPDSFLHWGFFNTIFQQKEYAESYVMEGMARNMMEKDPSLKTEFELKMAMDTTFAKDSEEILNWFYSKTPYWDSKFNIYPVGRILDAKEIDKLKLIK